MAGSDQYEVLAKIGQGSFGVIHKVRRKSDGYILCRKEISYTRMSQKEREQLHAELQILKNLRHPNIVAYYEREHLKATQDLYLYMEYCGNGDLGALIRELKRKNQWADEDFVWSVFAQLVSALYRCHYGDDPPEVGGNVMKGLALNPQPLKSKQSHNVILHRDLKPENVFLDSGNSVKLGDFGLSKILQSHDFASTYVGTPFYMSPEICSSERYTASSDIWSLGCIIYELCAREPPFNARNHYELIQKIKSGRVASLPSQYSSELNELIQNCLKVNPNMRPNTTDLLNLPVVRLMRKEQEVAILGKQLEYQRDMATRELEDAKARLREEIDAGLRREWEVKARLEIDRQVNLAQNDLYQKYETLFHSRVKEEVDRYIAEFKASHATQPAALAPAAVQAPVAAHAPIPCPPVRSASSPEEDTQNTLQLAKSSGTSRTSGGSSDFPSQTDASSISLEETQPKPQKTRRSFQRAKTSHNIKKCIGSPMDYELTNTTNPVPSISSLSLSPRRSERPQAHRPPNIFDKAARAPTILPPEIFEPSDEENEDPAPKSPSIRPRMKAAAKPVLRPMATIPIVATTSPTRVKGKTLIQLAQERADVAKWDPTRDEMPSPFIKRSAPLLTTR